jgi:UDP-2,3-diacylglucosamine pyrophosphatase LpxH
VSAEASRQRRLLILSDIHLGRDCKEITGFERSARPGPAFDDALIDLITHYTAGSESDWRIVFNGDFIDFIEVVVVPEETGILNFHTSFDVTDEEKEFGLGSEPERVIVKLERTLAYHAQFFTHLARFIYSGGDVVMVRGNHDIELFWPKVQGVFRRKLAGFAFRDQMVDLDAMLVARRAFQERITFAPWIYYEEGRIYAEHGHQYDPYCSIDYQLYPVSPTNTRRIDMPVSAFAMRFFVNLMNDFTPDDAGRWRLPDYIRWFRSRGIGGGLYAARMAIGAGFRAIWYAVRYARGQVQKYGLEHARGMNDEAARYGVSIEKLRSIDSLHHIPVSRNLPELLRLMYLDRVLLTLGVGLVVLLFLFTFESGWVEFVGVLILGAIGAWINRRMKPRQYLVSGPKQARSAGRIADILDVPLVVMGHSHVRQSVHLSEGRRYVNTGCWLPAPAEQEHIDDRAPCTCRLSHLVVGIDGQAELRTFCRVNRTVRLADVEPRRASSIIREETEGLAT